MKIKSVLKPLCKHVAEKYGEESVVVVFRDRLQAAVARREYERTVTLRAARVVCHVSQQERPTMTAITGLQCISTGSWCLAGSFSVDRRPLARRLFA